MNKTIYRSSKISMRSVQLIPIVVSLILISACNDVDHTAGQKSMPLIVSDSSQLSKEVFYHAPEDILRANFKNPPERVKPWVYWYWVSDNVSKTGIENDLAAMQKTGINTALIGIIHLKGEQGEVKALTDSWWDHVRFAIKKAADYNIDIGLFNSPGWSQSGGPWVTPERSMRYLDSTEQQIVGPQQVNMILDQPENTGNDFFQDVRLLAINRLTHFLMEIKTHFTRCQKMCSSINAKVLVVMVSYKLI
jgi:hypothetical protein